MNLLKSLGPSFKGENSEKKFHDIQDVRFEGDFLIIKLDTGAKRFSLKAVSKKLEKASREKRQNFIISPSGYGIHWPMLNEDLSIDSLLGITHRPQKIATRTV